MTTILATMKTRSRHRGTESEAVNYRHPHYECSELGETLRLTVYVPGVDSSGVEITAKGPDLTITARKRHFVRVNFEGLHLEPVQKDYHLSLRLGRHLDYTAMKAELVDGVLTLELPRRATPPRLERLRHAA